MLEVNISDRSGGFALEVKFAAATPGVVALFGRSGSGKTSVIQAIAGLRSGVRGRIALDDWAVLDSAHALDLPPEARRIGYVFQDARLFPHLRVRGNLQYGAKRARAAAYVGFDQVVELLDLRSLMERRTHQLSGGEKQRVAIGRALLAQPRLLLLDEPLAGLDSGRRDEVLPYLEALRDQGSVPMVYVSHQFDEVLRLATHLVILESGSSVADGDVARMSLDARLTQQLRPDEVGAILDAVVIAPDVSGELLRVRIGTGELALPCAPMAAGKRLRLQVLARDIIIATQQTKGLSVRNSVRGRITEVRPDRGDGVLVLIDIGGARLMARITRAATLELGLHAGREVWALIKSVALQGHAAGRVT